MGLILKGRVSGRAILKAGLVSATTLSMPGIVRAPNKSLKVGTSKDAGVSC